MARKVTTKTISAKVTLEEFGLICQRAGQANKTVSGYINELIFPSEAKGSVNALKNEISRLEVEIEQLKSWGLNIQEELNKQELLTKELSQVNRQIEKERDRLLKIVNKHN